MVVKSIKLNLKRKNQKNQAILNLNQNQCYPAKTTILEKLGSFVYVFLKTSYFLSASFVYFFIFLFTFEEGNIYLSLRSLSIDDVYVGKMPTKHMI